MNIITSNNLSLAITRFISQPEKGRLKWFCALIVLLLSLSISAQNEPENPHSPGFTDGKTNTDLINAQVKYWDHYYNEHYFSKGETPDKVTGYNPYVRCKKSALSLHNGGGDIPKHALWMAFKNHHENFQSIDGVWDPIGPLPMWDERRKTGN